MSQEDGSLSPAEVIAVALDEQPLPPPDLLPDIPPVMVLSPSEPSTADQLLSTCQDILVSAGSFAQVALLATDADGRGVRLRITAKALDIARFAASSVTTALSREWKYLGDGPDLETGQASCYVHVTLP